MNILSDFGDVLSGGKLVPQKKLEIDPSICVLNSVSSSMEERIFAIRERAISFTGEDFDIWEISKESKPLIKVRGAMLHLPGKDKMKILSKSEVGGYTAVSQVERKLVAVTPTYDIFRSSTNEKIGWIEKKIVSLTESFDIFQEGSGFGVTGLFKKPPIYTLSGDFFDRNFMMKNNKGETVARCSKTGFVQFDAFNSYQVKIAPGMDAVLVLTCICCIDEALDEEHKERRQKEKKRIEN